jgi:hypothetical protein
MTDNTNLEQKEPILTFEHPFKVEVYEPDFEPLSSIQFLDEKKLSTGDHSIEFGYMTGGCCTKQVYAIIKNGMVVGIKAEECKDSEEFVPKEIAELFSIAVKKLDFPEYQPVSVETFLTTIKSGNFGIKTAQCFWICVWRWCLFCCEATMTSSTPKCWIENRSPGGPIIVIGGNP